MVGHGDPAGRAVAQDEVFIVEGLPVDAAAAGAVAIDDVTHLDHEVGHDAVDIGALVEQGGIPQLVATSDRHEVEGRHRGGLPEHGHHKASCVVLARAIEALDLHLEPDFVGHGIFPTICRSQ